ncbi:MULTISPECIES: glycoside hydrolase family 32 protein [Arthrobacter]|uniref:beta-fructofuranosidase n=2 Tax=Arthrobacter TaxID=1663 RepID=A0ABU9KKT6_9MICC|nr:glycoside hydrolase family 32 protein [Arthrobacter sp. YJM1]MDP5227510.1 glycoside hydrolase family 32 protein [Arthrobacter sp. YJM1]
MTQTVAIPFAHTAATHPDPAFPRLHPRPAQGWINDPNGVCRLGGRYHVFFQFNPESARHHRIQWGHVSSADLVHWEEHPVALKPQDGGPDDYGCWTGVVTDDDGVPTAAYSGVRADGGVSQVVIARGSADLVDWTQDGHVAASMPEDPQVTAVRDPFMFRFQGVRYAVQGAGLADGRAALLLYRVEDVRSWEYLGIWLTTDNPVGPGHAVNRAEIWECPQLVRIPDSDGGEAWLAMFSLWQKDDDHEHALGVGHLVGTMTADPKTGLPVFTAGSAGTSDLGRDFYAPQITQLGDAPDGSPRVLLSGWANEGPGRDGRRGRSQAEIDNAGWAGVLTHPRSLRLVDGALEVAPFDAVDAYRAQELTVRGGAVTLPAQGEAAVVARSTATVTVRLGDLELLCEELGAGEELRVFVDASLLEVYRSGQVATTLRIYPVDGEELRVESDGEVLISAWRLALPEA